MSRRDDERLDDILAAADAISSHLDRGDLTDGLVFDAVRVRLIEIGEAVRSITPETLEREPDIPWRDVAGMRNHLAHRYFDTAFSIVEATVGHDLPPLVDAAHRLLAARSVPPVEQDSDTGLGVIRTGRPVSDADVADALDEPTSWSSSPGDA